MAFTLEHCQNVLNLAPVRVPGGREAAVPLRRQKLLRADRRQAQGGGGGRRRGRRPRGQGQEVCQGEGIARLQPDFCLTGYRSRLNFNVLCGFMAKFLPAKDPLTDYTAWQLAGYTAFNRLQIV